MLNKYHAALLVVICVVLTATVRAQQPAPVEFPTLNTVESTTVPVRDRVALAQQINGVGEIPPPPAAAPLRQVGERAIFRATDTGSDRAFTVRAELMAMGEHIYLWVEEGADIARADIEALAAAFDERIYARVRALWGSEASPGIDGDPRIHGLFARSLGFGTAAYYISEHAYPVEAVPTSNEHEMFFFNLDVLTSPIDLRSVESIVAHEFQHMIRNNIQRNEEYWLNEGFSEFTQVHLYDVPVWEMMSFLSVPDTQLNTWAEDHAARSRHYGASLLFVTYFHDRFGLEALRRFSDDDASRGLESADRVLSALGEPGVNEFFADWVVANVLFDPSLADGRYGYTSIPAGVVTVTPVDRVERYPWVYDGTVAQYATDYFTLDNLDGIGTLTVNLDMPQTVRLVDAAPASGQQMWYSNKGDMSSTTLTRRFDLSRVQRATLEFRLWYHIESLWDYGYVMVSTDNGATWQPLIGEHTTFNNPHSVAYGAGYTGVSGGGETSAWVDERISLDGFVGDDILLRFQMITDDAITQPGMLIDDVRIRELNYFEDFEQGGGGWLAEGWLWIDNVLPQAAWVQAVQHLDDNTTVTRWLAPTNGKWTLTLADGVEQVTLAVSAFASTTTVPMPYRLRLTTD
jgi:hypothetical protein